MSIDYLANKNAHERDSHVIFDEGPHIYTVDGDDSFMSVTTWNHSHFEHFDADKIITNMMKSKNWKKSKYYGKTREEIKKMWDDNRDNAASAGTKMHYDIECYYNNMDINNDSTEYKWFLEFDDWVRANTNMFPYRTEMIVWDKELKLCGSIDMLYENEFGELELYDWKRCKEIKKNSSFNKWSTTECIEHFPDSNFWHYSLQLNTYKYMLEKNYNKKVNGMYLICLHPNNKNGSYLKYKVSDLQDEIKDLMKLRLDMVEKEKLETNNKGWGIDKKGNYITTHDTNGKFVQKLYYD